MSDQLPDPIDASIPGVFHFDDLTIYSLSGGIFLVGISKSYAEQLLDNWEGLEKVLEDVLGPHYVLLAGQGEFTPLPQQLKDEIRAVVLEVVGEVLKP